MLKITIQDKHIATAYKLANGCWSVMFKNGHSIGADNHADIQRVVYRYLRNGW